MKKHIRAQEIAREHGVPCVYVGMYHIVVLYVLSLTLEQWSLEVLRCHIKLMYVVIPSFLLCTLE